MVKGRADSPFHSGITSDHNGRNIGWAGEPRILVPRTRRARAPLQWPISFSNDSNTISLRNDSNTISFRNDSNTISFRNDSNTISFRNDSNSQSF